MAKKDFLYCEETDTKIRNNDVVSISTYPDMKWIAKQGWYTIGSAQKHGWYFVSITDKTILPIDQVDITTISKDSRQAASSSRSEVQADVPAEAINNVDYLYIEDQGITIRPNDIVEFTTTLGGELIKCVVKYGWYKLDTEQKQGWYFLSISDRKIIPLDLVDTNTIVKEQIVGTSELRPTLEDIDTPLPDIQYVVVPGTDIRFYDSDIIKIDTRPGLKWIVHVGWYIYQGVQSYGWYFVSIKDGEILPVSVIDLTLCSLDTLKTQGSELYDGKVVNFTRPFTPADAEVLRRTFITLDTIEQRDNLDTSKLVDGRLVRVNNVGGVVGYYSWNVATRSWEKVDWGSSGSEGIPEIVGKEDHPIILSELDVGLYRVIGYYKITAKDETATHTDIDHLVFVSGNTEIQVKVITEDAVTDYTVLHGEITLIAPYATKQYVDDRIAWLDHKISEIISELLADLPDMIDERITEVMVPIPNDFITGLFPPDLVERVLHNA